MISVGRVKHWIPNTDMRNNHAGLADLAYKKLGVKVADLKPGEFILFVNTAVTAVKVFGADNTILHHKHPQGHVLNARALINLPHFIRGGQINYDKALRAEVLKYIDVEHKTLS